MSVEGDGEPDYCGGHFCLDRHRSLDKIHAGICGRPQRPAGQLGRKEPRAGDRGGPTSCYPVPPHWLRNWEAKDRFWRYYGLRGPKTQIQSHQTKRAPRNGPGFQSVAAEAFALGEGRVRNRPSLVSLGPRLGAPGHDRHLQSLPARIASQSSLEEGLQPPIISNIFFCVCMIFGIWLALPGLRLYGKNHI